MGAVYRKGVLQVDAREILRHIRVQWRHDLAAVFLRCMKYLVYDRAQPWPRNDDQAPEKGCEQMICKLQSASPTHRLNLLHVISRLISGICPAHDLPARCVCMPVVPPPSTRKKFAMVRWAG